MPNPPNPQDANGADTPAAGGAGPVEAREQAAGFGVEALQTVEVDWLDPAAQIPFAPWPSEEVIRRGALAQIQVMLERGVDPAGVTAGPRPEKEEGESERAVKVEENGEGATEVVKRTAAAEDGEVKVENAVAGPRERKEEKPRVFGGLDLYDPDAE